MTSPKNEGQTNSKHLLEDLYFMPTKPTDQPKRRGRPRKAALAVVKKPAHRPPQYPFDPALGTITHAAINAPALFFKLWRTRPEVFRARIEEVLKEFS